MSNTALHRASVVAALVAAAGCAGKPPVDLSPGTWPAGELDRYLALTSEIGKAKGLGEGDSAMVTGTTGAFAVRAGRETLRQGGNAIDAAITTALAQIALAGGSWVSYAGFLNLIYYDAATNSVHSLNAGFNTVAGERDPATIPACLGPTGMIPYQPSGRTALVPGFFAGVEAAHRRFGRLPFEKLFAPAIFLADSGFKVSGILAGAFAYRKDLFKRLPATGAVFLKSGGTPYQPGDLFRQPALAATLRQVASRGADHIYRGEWARQLVAAVQADGGKMTLEDLAQYRAQWSEPIRATYRGYQLLGAAWPTFGATATLEAMQVLEHVDLPNGPKYWESAETLYPFIEASHIQFLDGPPGGGVGVPADWAQTKFPTQDLSPAGRLKRETAAFWWSQLKNPTSWRAVEKEAAEAQARVQAALRQTSGGGGHSDAVVATDAEGNVAALTHTINTVLFGGTGITVGGITIPDAACFQQDLIRRAGPGVRLPDPTNPIIVMKDGRWVLAGSSIGAGLLENTLAVLVNVLDYGRDPDAALHAPQFSGSGLLGPQVLPTEDFSEAVVAALNARGGHAILQPKQQIRSSFGSWISIQRDPKTGRLRGATRDLYNGAVEAY
ncbi:MAG: gamma-glutamyltransferase [Gemmatimonadales bacterium]